MRRIRNVERDAQYLYVFENLSLGGYGKMSILIEQPKPSIGLKENGQAFISVHEVSEAMTEYYKLKFGNDGHCGLRYDVTQFMNLQCDQIEFEINEDT
eukprot:4457082-Lingulodinium_polyedra.AAC.1